MKKFITFLMAMVLTAGIINVAVPCDDKDISDIGFQNTSIRKYW